MRPDLFRLAMPVCAVVGALGLLMPGEVAAAFQSFTGTAFKHLDWFFLYVMSGFMVLALVLAISPVGRVRLGRDAPEFSTLAWLAMLFAAGMGSGLMFWGVAEPLMHAAAPPIQTADRAQTSLILTNYHWGLHAWACYAIGALVLAYFRFCRGTDYQPSAPIRSAFSGRWVRPVAAIADFTAVLAVAFGVCGSIAMGGLQFQSGVIAVTGADLAGLGFRVVILVALFACYTASAATSLDRGIKVLSQTNMTLAIGLLVFLLFVGPTADLIDSAAASTWHYLAALPELSFTLWAPPDKTGWFHGWTIVYFIWWIAWTPFVGIFIARISRGRSIRQFLAGVILAPTGFSLVWFAVFGGVGMAEDQASGGAIAAAVQADVATALFGLFERLPGTALLGAIALTLVFVFLVTSVDSATFVLGMLTSEGVESPPTNRKIAWGVALALMGGALFMKGDIEVVKALSTSGAIPFVPILLLQVAALFVALRADGARRQRKAPERP